MRSTRTVARSGSMVFALALWVGVLALVILPVAAHAAGSVYVANARSGGSTVSQFAIGAGGLLSPLSPATVAADSEPLAVAVTPDGRSVYVTNAGRNTVSQYTVDPSTGALSPKVPATVATGPSQTGPAGVAVTPDGKSAYVTNASGNTVAQFTIDLVSGVLSPKTPATLATGTSPHGVAVTPDGKSVYVTNFGLNPPNPLATDTISQYSIDPATGVLTPKTPATVPTGAGPLGVALAPDGKSVYVANDFGGAVSQYNVDPLSGVLRPKFPATVATGSNPLSVAVTPDGTSAYVTNPAGVAQYSVDPLSGVLSPKFPATIAAGDLPEGVVVTPDGKSAYVTDEGFNMVSQYNVDAVTGALSPKTPAIVTAGDGPFGIAVGPLPLAKRATSTSVRCAPSRFAPGDSTVCRATVTDTAGSGQSTPTGTVGFTHSGSGSLYGSPCTLSGSGVSASCWVFFSSFPRGGQAIIASYTGDSEHSTSTGATLVSVAVPASTSGCLVFGHGRITAANGDQASFRGLAFAKPPRGAEWYRDNGPAKPFRLLSTRVDAVTCSADASRASVFGKARVNGTGSVEYRIDIQLTAWERGQDTYRIRLSNGYDSGPRQIGHGDLDIHLRQSNHRHRDANANQTQGGGQDGG